MRLRKTIALVINRPVDGPRGGFGTVQLDTAIVMPNGLQLPAQNRFQIYRTAVRFIHGRQPLREKARQSFQMFLLLQVGHIPQDNKA
jgi:hypothetical protein